MDNIGIIFDMNGTLIFDSRYHIDAWRIFVEELTFKQPTDEDVNRFIVGKTAKEILEHFTGYELSDDMITQFTDEKERVYRSLIARDDLPLAPGVTEFLNFLLLSRVPITIASTANLENMNYYFERYNLERWFRWEKVIIANGTIPLKPHPDMYIAAINKLGLEASKVAVFEDSTAGVRAAFNAGVRNIIAVTGDNTDESVRALPGIIACIKDFNDLGKDLKEIYVQA